MDNTGGRTPRDSDDIRNALQKLGIEWRTEENLNQLHKLAEQSLFAAKQILGAFALADTVNALPKEVLSIWLSLFLKTVVEKVIFPHPLPAGATTWESHAAIWDEYIAYSREFHATGARTICETDAWSIRGAVSAAWNIELSTNGQPAEIGPVAGDSAHRTALRFASDLWIRYSLYLDQSLDAPEKRGKLWEHFTSRWADDKVLQQCDSVRSRLASELAEMRRRLVPPVSVTIDDQMPGGMNGLCVLWSLKNGMALKQAEIIAVLDDDPEVKKMSIRTLRGTLKLLCTSGLVKQAIPGGRSGYAITSEGKQTYKKHENLLIAASHAP